MQQLRRLRIERQLADTPLRRLCGELSVMPLCRLLLWRVKDLRHETVVDSGVRVPLRRRRRRRRVVLEWLSVGAGAAERWVLLQPHLSRPQRRQVPRQQLLRRRVDVVVDSGVFLPVVLLVLGVDVDDVLLHDSLGMLLLLVRCCGDGGQLRLRLRLRCSCCRRVRLRLLLHGGNGLLSGRRRSSRTKVSGLQQVLLLLLLLLPLLCKHEVVEVDTVHLRREMRALRMRQAREVVHVRSAVVDLLLVLRCRSCSRRVAAGRFESSLLVIIR